MDRPAQAANSVHKAHREKPASQGLACRDSADKLAPSGPKVSLEPRVPKACLVRVVFTASQAPLALLADQVLKVEAAAAGIRDRPEPLAPWAIQVALELRELLVNRVVPAAAVHQVFRARQVSAAEVAAVERRACLGRRGKAEPVG